MSRGFLSSRQFGGGSVVFHGTTIRGAEMMQQGLKPSGQSQHGSPDPYGLGVGVHVTNSPRVAATFGEQKASGKSMGPLGRETAEYDGPRTGKRIWTTVVMRPKEGSSPKAKRSLNSLQNVGDTDALEELYSPEDLEIVGTQPIYRTSAQRARYGSGYEELQRRRRASMIPPTRQQLKERAQRRKRVQSSMENFQQRATSGDFTVEDFN